MSIQKLNGITVSCSGPQNLARFGKYLINGSFPQSSCFNAWIYSCSSEINFSEKPSEIKLSLILETPNTNQQYAFFDILDSDLNCSAGNGGIQNENTWNFNFNGINFYNYVLYDKEITIEAGQKLLNVTFKDYSIILDKIYVGLTNRQGNQFVYESIENIKYPINCYDCIVTGDFFWTTGTIQRELGYASYVGINGKTYDNFSAVPYANGIYTQWTQLFNLQSNPYSITFDLNGGYLIIGNEEASEQLCGNVVPVGYNFNELLASLRIRGLNFIGDFPGQQNDRDFVYRQNYVGTLRTVLQQWCSDLAYDFYVSGRSFIGINLNNSIDISQITAIADPTTTLGQDFQLNSNSEIISYKSKSTLENTWRQGIITSSNRAEDSQIASETLYRYVGMLPMHPLDFNYPNNRIVQRSDVFGNYYSDTSLASSFLPVSTDLQLRCDRLDNRNFNDIDTSIALTRYNSNLRDIYCQQQAYNAINGSPDANANFLALGLVPLVEITGTADKTPAIRFAVGGLNPFEGGGDEISNINLDQQYYRVFIGYSYSDFKEKVVTWEQNAAESMYKYGAIKQGLVQGPPYIPYDILQDISPGSGLSGSLGSKVYKITEKTNPACYQYWGWNYLPVLPYYPSRQSLVTAPFRDILLYSGIGSIYDPELYIGEIAMNDWGTSLEDFNRNLSLQLNDACIESFQSEPTYTDYQAGFDSSDHKIQDWKLELFTPKAIFNLDDFFDQYSSYFDMLSGEGIMDRLVRTYYNINYKLQQDCSKLHIIVLTDTINHPNISVSFNQIGKQFINGAVLVKYNQQLESWAIQRELTPTLNICEVPLLMQMCENVLYADYLEYPTSPKYGCAIQNPYDQYLPGFGSAYVTSLNSRGLQLSITKNPVQNNPDNIQSLTQGTDIEGDIYYSNILSELFQPQIPQTANLTIVYPASIEANDNEYYNCALTTSISIDNRSPAITEIYGNSPNIANNNASTIKVINNFLTPPLQAVLDPYAQRFLSYMTVITGNNASIVNTISGYVQYLDNLYSYENINPMKSVSLELAGTPDFFGSFSQYLYPQYGLTNFSINVSDKGVTTLLQFNDRPKILPKQETYLNAIVARLN